MKSYTHVRWQIPILAFLSFVSFSASACSGRPERQPAAGDGSAAFDVAIPEPNAWVTPTSTADLRDLEHAGKYVDFSKLSARDRTSALTTLKDLGGIRIANRRVDSEALSTAVARSPSLLSVDLTSASGVDEDCLGTICALPRLQHLRLFDVTSVRDRHFIQLGQQRCLETLDVGLSRWLEPVTEYGVISESVAFQAVARAAPLRWLRCSGRELVDERGAELLAVQNRLEVFICGRSNRPAVPMDVLTTLLRCPLRVLHAGRRNAATDWRPADAADIESRLRHALLACRTLVSVNLDYRVTNADALATGLHRNQSILAEFSVRGSDGLSDGGLELLGRLKHLAALDVIDCARITRRGLSQLASSRALRRMAFGTLQGASSPVDSEVFSAIASNRRITHVSVAIGKAEVDLSGMVAMSDLGQLDLISIGSPLPEGWASTVSRMKSLKTLRVQGASKLMPSDLDRVLANREIAEVILVSCSGAAIERFHDTEGAVPARVALRIEE